MKRFVKRESMIRKRVKVKSDFDNGEIIIKRVSNGWVVYSGSGYESDHTRITVYEEGEDEWGEHEALVKLIQESFIHLVQSKKRGGIKMEVREKGWDIEYEEEE